MYDKPDAYVNGLSTLFPHVDGALIEVPRDYLIVGGPNEAAGIGHNGPPVDEEELDELDPVVEREGWVRISRAMRDHWLVGFGQPVKPCDPEKGFCYSRAEAWLDLIMECRYSAGTVNNNGRKMEIKPGQLLGAVSWLASRWNWTPKTVRGFLDKLAADGMIETGTNQGATKPGDQKGESETARKGKYANIITICKYELYQLASRIQGQVDGQAKGQVEGREKGELGASSGQHIKVETKEQRNKKKEPKGSMSADVLWAFETYNQTALECGLRQASRLTPKRQASIGARLKEFERGGWERMLAEIRQSDFLCGKNTRGWKPDLDWLIGPDDFAKVHDGRYRNDTAGRSKRPPAHMVR